MGFRREEAYQKIQAAILSGDLRPGEKLVEKELCAEFQLGRTPLREAFNQLAAEGYLDIVPNKGALVRKVPIQDAEHIYDILALLEGYGVETATGHIKPEHEDELRAIQNGCKKAARARDVAAWLENNSLFHGYFPKLTGNVCLCGEIEALRRKLYQYRFITFALPMYLEKHLGAHEMVLTAISRKDAKRAGNVMRRHLMHVRRMLVDAFKQYAWP
jgi:DNA-binding GntR family transcriptional regulator